MKQKALSPKQIGEKLKQAIADSQWRTQQNFADAFHCDLRTLGRWCNNGIDKLSLLNEIADFLDIDVSTLLFA